MTFPIKRRCPLLVHRANANAKGWHPLAPDVVLANGTLLLVQ
jgi:hypothetical protein